MILTGWTPVSTLFFLYWSRVWCYAAPAAIEGASMSCWRAPASVDIAELKRNLHRSVPEVRNVHHVHVWLVGEKRL